MARPRGWLSSLALEQLLVTGHLWNLASLWKVKNHLPIPFYSNQDLKNKQTPKVQAWQLLSWGQHSCSVCASAWSCWLPNPCCESHLEPDPTEPTEASFIVWILTSTIYLCNITTLLYTSFCLTRLFWLAYSESVLSLFLPTALFVQLNLLLIL